MAGFHFTRFNAQFPTAQKRIELCHDHAKSMIWLQLTNSEWIITGLPSARFVTVLIGAVKQGDGWVSMDAGTAARLRDVTLALGTNLASKDTGRFQKAIVDHWRGFNSRQASQWAKGLTIGKSLTSAGFVMKALKTGFDAIGEPMSAYSGVRFRDFYAEDVLDYVRSRSAKAGAIFRDGGLSDFIELGPSPAFEPPYVQDPARTSDYRTITTLASAKAARHNRQFSYSALTDKYRKIRRVVAYGFRGDSRPPSLIKNAGGFLPNYTRPSHIDKFRARSQTSALNLRLFLRDQRYGGYVSVTKSVAVAKGFATGLGGTTSSGSGWVYACFVEGGFDVPQPSPSKAATDPASWVKYREQEISMPGMLDWEDVVACRHVRVDGSFDGNVFIKPSLFKEEPDVIPRLWELLSGRSQNTA